MRDLTEIVRENDKAAERERREAQEELAQLDRWPTVSHRINLAEPAEAPVLRACEICGKLTASPQNWDCKMPGRRCRGHVVCASCRPAAERGRDEALAILRDLQTMAALMFEPSSKPPTIH